MRIDYIGFLKIPLEMTDFTRMFILYHLCFCFLSPAPLQKLGTITMLVTPCCSGHANILYDGLLLIHRRSLDLENPISNSSSPPGCALS